MLKIHLKVLILFSVTLVGLSLSACKDDNDGVSTNCVSATERVQVIGRAEQLINARLTNLNAASAELLLSLQNLNSNPSRLALSEARGELNLAKIAYHQLGPYSLIVDPTASIPENFNAFPVDTSLVLASLSQGSWNAQSMSNFDRGLPAIEFLLHRAGSDSLLIRQEPMAVASLSLAIAYAQDMANRAAQLESTWLTSQSLAFRQELGTDAGSALSRYINSINKHLEDLRRDQVGLPFGASLGFPSPRAVESYYSGNSLLYLTETIKASRTALGDFDIAGTLGNYVAQLNNSEAPALAADIVQQYDLMVSAAEAISPPLSQAVVNDREAVKLLYDAMSRQVVFLKTDLPSLSCVAITYVDNPSDSD